MMVASGWVSYAMWSLTRERSVSGQWWSAATSVVLTHPLATIIVSGAADLKV